MARYNEGQERHYLLGEIKLKNETLELLLQGTVTGVVRLLSDIVASIGEDIAAQNVRIKNLGNAVIKMTPEIDDKEAWDIGRAFELFNLGLALLPPLIQMRIGKEGFRAVASLPVAANHHILAADLLRGIPQFENVARIILLQKKNFDGTGEPYSDRAKENDIPLGSRILKILLDMEFQSTDNFKGREVLERMKGMDRVYDTELIGKLLGSQQTIRPKRRDVKIPMSQLSVGMVLLEDLMTQNGQLLLRKNSTLTETICKLLSQWGNVDPIISPVRVLLNEDQAWS